MRAAIVLAVVLACGAAGAGESPTAFSLAQARAKAAVARSKSRSDGEIVRASWYGAPGEALSRFTASGEPFDAHAHTAAHRNLPFGTRVEVTNLANGRSTIVRVNDRGPAASTGRALDLSKGAAEAIDMLRAGEARVSYRIIN